jgi:arylsulfatase A-like enzyme
LVHVDRAIAQGDRPNIILIVTDDQSPLTLSTYGNQVCQTPHLDRLASDGLTFDAAYHMGSWLGAVCTPSRHMIMTGRTVWHLPNRRRAGRRAQPSRGSPNEGNPNEGNPRLVPPDLADYSMPAIFNRAGYDTFRTCKRGNSYEGANKRFTIRHDASKRGGTPETGSAWHGDRAIDFLKQRESNNDSNPFLMYVGFSHPHDVRDGTPELLAKYGAKNVKQPPTTVNEQAPPLPITYLPAHPFHHGHPGLRDEEKVSGVFTSRSEATIRNELGREYACIENIDTQVGRILRQLERMGELDNTYILFTSDHGIAVGRHGLTGKQNLYEHTWRIPLIAMGPGIKSSSRAPGNVYLLDILPTLCDLAGISQPDTIEGKSFQSILEGEAETVRDVLYGVYCGGTKPGMRCVRKGDWKLIKYDVLDGAVRETQLFNLKDNPNELLEQHQTPEVVALTGNQPRREQVNLADDPRYAGIRKEMEALLLAEQERLDDPYRLWDQR